MRLKVCGMKYNPEQVAALQPEYLGFIFYDKSPRDFSAELPQLPKKIKKVGVFVDAKEEEVLKKIENYQLDAVQLHGHESPDYCRVLKESGTQVIKVFSIKDSFDFSKLTPYEEVVDFYLFDTKGKLPGGNGYAFDWNALNDYPSTKPFFLSGGIGIDEIDRLHKFLKSKTAEFCHAIDVNSRFEMEPGLKDVEQLKKFKSLL